MIGVPSAGWSEILTVFTVPLPRTTGSYILSSVSVVIFIIQGVSEVVNYLPIISIM